jgi:hypothetical protein
LSGVYYEAIPERGEWFECGCAASNVEWVRSPNALYHYDYAPVVMRGERVCPAHGKPLLSEPPVSGRPGGSESTPSLSEPAAGDSDSSRPNGRSKGDEAAGSESDEVEGYSRP